MGRRKVPRHPHEDTGGPAKTNENAVLSTIFGLSARREFGAAKSARTAGQETPRPAQEPPKSRQNRSREAARAIQDGPGAVQEEPGAARSRPGSAKTAPELPQSRPRAAKTAPRAPQNGFRGAQVGGRRASRPVSAPSRALSETSVVLWDRFRGPSRTEELHRHDHGVVRPQAEPNDWPAPSHDRISSTI